ncbi:MAG: hypothetical protein MUO64_11185 [Anaerolineales bacterium]|nr:hypothetical protein [Anaerolineales bacterium]
MTSLIDCGRAHDEAEKVFTMGANFRMTELQAALSKAPWKDSLHRSRNALIWQLTWMRL